MKSPLAIMTAAFLLLPILTLTAQPRVVNAFRAELPVKDIVFRNSMEGYMMGEQYVWKTTDGGASWTQDFPLPFHPPKTAIAVLGETGLMIGTQDGGIHFTRHPDSLWTYSQPIQGQTIRDIEVISENHWVAVTDSTILSTIDGGKTYRTFIPDNNSTVITALDVTDASLMHVIERFRNIWRSTDGGETWHLLDNTDAVFGTLYDLRFTSPDTGFVASWYPWNLFTTTDGGQTWSAGPYEYPTSIAIAQGGTGAYATSELVKLSNDGGMTWSDSLKFGETFPGFEYREQKVLVAGESSVFVLLTNFNEIGQGQSIIARIDRASGVKSEGRKYNVQLDLR